MSRLSPLCFGLLLSSSLSQADSVQHLLGLSLEELMNVEITTASKRSEKVSEIPASVEIITREDIQDFGYNSLTELLSNVTGFYNIEAYSGISGNFGIRGLWNSREQNSSVVVLVNGVNQIKADSRSNPYLNIPVNVIDRVEIIRGPMSVMYGSGAVFGVINIVTNEASSEQPLEKALYVKYGVDSRNEKELALTFGRSEGAVPFSINMGLNQDDGYDYPISEMMGEVNYASLPFVGVENPDSYTFNGLLEKRYRYLDVSAQWQQWSFDINYNDAYSEDFALMPPVEDGSSLESEKLAMRVAHKMSYGDIIWNNSLTYSRYESERDFDFLMPSLVGVHESEYDYFELESLINKNVLQDVDLILGANYQYLSDRYAYTHVPAVGAFHQKIFVDHRDVFSVFLQAHYQYSEALSLIAGARYERVGRYDREGILEDASGEQRAFGGPEGGQSHTTPRIALVYTPKKHHIVKLMYGVASKVVNDRFDAERIKTSEINYHYAKDKFRFNASLYKNDLRKLIREVLRVGPDGGVNNDSIQDGNITTEGIELDLTMPLNHSLSFTLGYAYQDSSDEVSTMIDQAYSPKQVAQSRITYRQQDFTAALLARYVDSMKPTYDTAKANLDGSFGGRIGDTVDGYTVVDINLRMDNLYEKGFVNIRFSNLLDEEIRYPNNQFNSEVLDRGTLGESRGVVLSLGWEY